MFRVAIPSFNRSKILANTTIKLLINGGIRKCYIFLPSDQVVDYMQQLDHLDIKIEYCITPKQGIGNVRNYIRDYFDIGTKVFMIDDDIQNVYRRTNPIENLLDFIDSCFKTCISVGATLWGVQLFKNQFFLRDGINTKLTYINGSFTGFIKSRDEIKVDIDHMEDYLFSILHFARDGVLCKFSDVWLDTKPFLESGGIIGQQGGLEFRKKSAELNSKMLLEYFPDCLSIKKSVKYDIANIRLNYHTSWSEELAITAGLYVDNIENNDD